MQIDRILFPVTTLGPGNRLGIWTIGCPHRCFNCSNPELWNDDAEKDISLSELVSVFKDKKSTTDGVTITGGEPFYQVEELFLLLGILRQLEYSDILVYTGYKYEFIKETFAHVLEQIDVLVDGLYDDSLNNDVGQKGSANQRCIILNSELIDKYNDFDTKKRSRQNFVANGKIISVGIPTKCIYK
jgi:anaerobic ribonucleoside-triphosphate reductase activating protein